MKNLALLTLCIQLLITSFVSPTPASALSVPERLVYGVNWSGIKAGTAVHEVTAKDGELRLVYTVHSSKWFTPILSIDDRMESVLFRPGETALSGVPKLYRENIHEGKTHNVKEAQFDPARLQVHTKDFLNKTEKSDPISAKTFDSLSLIYFIRSSELVPGKLILVEMYDCKRLWTAEVQVVKREEISTPRGRFKTLMVKALLKFEGVMARNGNMTVWLTDDDRRIPVRITNQLKVGELTATLVEGSYWK
jgi:hypothetical protein